MEVNFFKSLFILNILLVYNQIIKLRIVSKVVRWDIVCYEVYAVVAQHIPHTSNTENVLLPQFVSLLATRPSCYSSIFTQFRHLPLRCPCKQQKWFFFCFMFCWPCMYVSRYFRVKRDRLDAQFIFSIFRQTPLHVSGLSIAHHQEAQQYIYNNWYLLFFLDDCLLSWTTDNHLNRTISTNCPGQQTVT